MNRQLQIKARNTKVAKFKIMAEILASWLNEEVGLSKVRHHIFTFLSD